MGVLTNRPPFWVWYVSTLVRLFRFVFIFVVQLINFAFFRDILIVLRSWRISVDFLFMLTSETWLTKRIVKAFVAIHSSNES